MRSATIKKKLLVLSLFICSPLNDVINDYIGSNHWITVYNKPEWMQNYPRVANLRYDFHQRFATCEQMQTSVGPRSTR